MKVYRFKFLAFGFLLLVGYALRAQNGLSYYDSLYEVAESHRNGQRYDEALAIYDQVKEFPEWMGNPSNARKLFNNKGLAFYKTQSYDSSATYYLKSNQGTLRQIVGE